MQRHPATESRWGPKAGSRLFPLLLASLALTLPCAWPSLASARGKVLKRPAAAQSRQGKRLSPPQQKARKQKRKARVHRVSRSPRQRRVRRFQSRRRSGIVLTRRGPMRQRAKRRTQFQLRSQARSRSIDQYGRWTRHDPYSIR